MPAQELFDEAIRFEEEGQLERALGMWRHLAETHPTRNVFLRLANITNELGLLEDAEHAFKHALEIDGRSASALKGLGILAIHNRDYEAGESYLRRACEIEEDPAGFTLLGVALAHTGREVEAEEAYRRAIRINPRYEEACLNLGVLLRNDRPSEAQVLLRTAVELDPGYACAYRELGFVLTKRGATTEAESHLRKAIQLEPDDFWAHVYLGTCLWRCADVDAAMAEFRIAGELEPESAVPLWSQGNLCEYEYEDFVAAQSYFERALQLDMGSQEALKSLGRLYKKRGRIDLAREYLNRALLLDPDDDRLRALLRELDGERAPSA